ncbi:MAG: arsenate reductase ArsC, partial [Desulfobacteraceae bacterium]|nr:arsenate reductase ArsC [Desulfobacteraceae bacterium]
FANHMKKDQIQAASAGIKANGLNPFAVKVMAESGVDISRQKSQLISEFDLKTFDFIITVCGHADKACPIVPAKCTKIHAGFEDPPALAQKVNTKQEKLDCYRKVRDRIKTYVENMPLNLTS